MLKEPVGDANDAEIAHIHGAAGLLRQMMLELENLGDNNPRLHFAMSSTGHAIRQRLNMLAGIAELLKDSAMPLRARELCQRAKRLIGQLNSELEDLASKAEHEFECIT
jgi:hypothetical protein